MTEKGDVWEPPCILLCRILNMEVVCSLQVQPGVIKNLQSKFGTNGYVEDLSEFYISLTNAKGEEVPVTQEIHKG